MAVYEKETDDLIWDQVSRISTFNGEHSITSICNARPRPIASSRPLPLEHHDLVLVLLHCGPHLLIRFHSDLLGRRVQLVETPKIHIFGQQRDHVLVESLPVRVLEVESVGQIILLDSRPSAS
nr:hypothetical protein CFP56_07912 [Quercus suber]